MLRLGFSLSYLPRALAVVALVRYRQGCGALIVRPLQKNVLCFPNANFSIRSTEHRLRSSAPLSAADDSAIPPPCVGGLADEAPCIHAERLDRELVRSLRTNPVGVLSVRLVRSRPWHLNVFVRHSGFLSSGPPEKSF